MPDTGPAAAICATCAGLRQALRRSLARLSIREYARRASDRARALDSTSSFSLMPPSSFVGSKRDSTCLGHVKTVPRKRSLSWKKPGRHLVNLGEGFVVKIGQHIVDMTFRNALVLAPKKVSGFTNDALSLPCGVN